jgi:cell division protein FtsB
MKVIIGILVMLFFVLQYELWYSSGGILDILHLKHEINQQTDVTKNIAEKNAMIEKEIYYLKNSKEAVEERAREELGMVKKGETFYQVVHEKKK